MIRKKIDAMLDALPEEELEHIYWSVIRVKEHYDHKQNLANKGITIDYNDGDSDIILKRWEATFATVSKQTKEEIHYESFKWHLYSYQKLPYLEGDAARKAFDEMTKTDVYFMYEGTPLVQVYKNAYNMVSTDIDNQQDIYLFDQTFSWTYIHTHEDMCGPYFVRL